MITCNESKSASLKFVYAEFSTVAFTVSKYRRTSGTPTEKRGSIARFGAVTSGKHSEQ
jgi:hypothetical protein